MRGLSFLCVGVLVLLTACHGMPSSKPESISVSEKPQTESRSTYKRLPVRPLNVATSCKFKDETGYGGQTVLDVRDGKVLQMHTVVNVPKKGQCTFDMTGMKQTQVMPSVEMKNAQNKCVVRIWEQGNNVTLSVTNCAARCSPKAAFEYVWPVMINTTSGKCS